MHDAFKTVWISTITIMFEKKYDLAVFAVILTIITVQLIKLGNYPGIYFDAIFPDYIAVQLLHPLELQSRWGQFSWPWLCQPYHGTNGIIITLLSVMITGSTSVLQHHITYGIVAAIAVFLCYKILTHQIIGVSKLWSGLGSVILISCPSLLAIVISQSYMCLFGSVCILGGVLAFLNWQNDVGALGRLSLCYFLFGLAFYSYFNFLFFFPPLLICTVFAMRRYGSVSFDDIVTPLLAFTLGFGIFIVGWSQRALMMNGVDMAAIGNKVKLFLAVYTLLTIVFIAFFKRIKRRKLLLVYLIAGGAVWLIKIMPAYREMSARYGIIQNTPLKERITAVINDYSSILTSEFAGFPGRRLFESVAVLNSHVILFGIIAVLVASATELLVRKCNVKWKIPVVVIVFYLCCCVVFGPRMNQHHYVPLLFITYLGFVLCVQRIFICISESNSAVCRYIARFKKNILMTAVLSLVLLNFFNAQKIIIYIRDTGGDNYWASEMTDLANEAVRRNDNGYREVYIFSEWGFMTSFDYLTMNKIPYMFYDNFNTYLLAEYYKQENKSLLKEYYTNGYDIVIYYYYWNEINTQNYAKILKDISDGKGTLKYKEWIDKNGHKEFCEIRLSHTNDETIASQKHGTIKLLK